jgi:hypothetical protein
MPEPFTILISFTTAVLGGLAASFYTNAKADARDDKKLQHDAEQKELDRKLALKKEIYMGVASDFARFQVALATLGDAPVADLKTQFPASDFAAGFARLELVAPLPLYSAAMDVGQFIRSVFGQLIVDRLLIQRELDTLAEIERLTEIAIRTEQEERPSQADLDRHRRSLETLHHGYRIHCMKQALELKKRLIPLVREMRREFDTAIDMKQFDTIQSAGLADAEAMIQKTISSLDHHFGTKPPPSQ